MTTFIFFLSWVVVTILLGALGMRHFVDSLLLALTPAAMLAAWFRMRRPLPEGHLYTAKGQPALRATYAANNIALDLPGSRLWLRDINGRTTIVDLEEVAAWEHTWTDTSNVWGQHFRTNNRLTFRLRQLDQPTVTVAFRRYGDTFSGNKNFQEAAEWQARLTNLING